MLRTLARLLSSRRRSTGRHPSPPPAARRFRPVLEALEDRTVLSTVFLVAPNQPTDGSHFTNLNSAVSSAGPGGTVVVEPGSIGGTYNLLGSNTGANATGITIMGDPNAGPLNLPSFNFSFTPTATSQGASGVTLTGLNLGTVVIGAGANGEQVLNNLVSGSITIDGGAGSAFNNGNNVLSGNFVNGTINVGTFSANDQIANNTVNTSAAAVAAATAGSAINVLGSDPGELIRNNTINITGPQLAAANTIGISVADSDGTVIDSNTININLDSSALSGAPGIVAGILVSDSGANAGTVSTAVQLNTVTTNNLAGAVGLRISSVGQTNANTAVTVQGNDFHGNATGVRYVADPADTTPLATTLGGQAQTGGAVSLGGNDFRGTNLAIDLTTTTGAPFPGGQKLAAQMNIFAGTPNTVAAGGGSVDTSGQLSTAEAFVQVLYEKLTGNVVGLSQLDPFAGFVNSFGSGGQQYVASQMELSAAGLGHLVDTVAQYLVGHPLGSTLRSSLVAQLQAGTVLGSVEAQIISTQDFYTRSGGNVLGTALQLLTGVTPSPIANQSLQQSQFATGTNGQPLGVQGVAQQINLSQQAVAQTVDQIFEKFLHRAPTANELALAVAFGGSRLNIELGVLATQEFLTNG